MYFDTLCSNVKREKYSKVSYLVFPFLVVEKSLCPEGIGRGWWSQLPHSFDFFQRAFLLLFQLLLASWIAFLKHCKMLLVVFLNLSSCGLLQGRKSQIQSVVAKRSSKLLKSILRWGNGRSLIHQFHKACMLLQLLLGVLVLMVVQHAWKVEKYGKIWKMKWCFIYSILGTFAYGNTKHC